MKWVGHEYDRDVKTSRVDRGYTDYSEEYALQEINKIDYELWNANKINKKCRFLGKNDKNSLPNLFPNITKREKLLWISPDSQLAICRNPWRGPLGIASGVRPRTDLFKSVFATKMTKKHSKWALFRWCLWSDLNRYGLFNRGILSPLCLPIPPHKHDFCEVFRFFVNFLLVSFCQKF